MTIHVKLETFYEDGSYTALVVHYGREFAVHFTAGELKVFGVAGVNHVKPWALKASVKAVKAWAKEKILAAGPAFLEAHKKLYGLDEVTL